MSVQATVANSAMAPALLSDSSETHQVCCSDLSEAASSRPSGSLSSTSGSDDEETEIDDEDETSVRAGADFRIPQRFTKSGRKRAVPFALKLMKVLSTKEFADVIGWLHNGKAFVVHKPKVFAATILPEHFKSAKYSSFTRKLHRWGFVRQYRGEETGAFYHADFQRDRLDLVEKLSCGKSNDEAFKASKREHAPKPFKKASLNATYSKKYRGDLQPAMAATMAVPPRGMPQISVHPDSNIRGFDGNNRLINGPRAFDVSMSNTQLFNPDLLVALHRQSMLDANPAWNSAVEMEVTRRLNLRLNAETTLSNLLRQQQQHQQQPTPFISHGPLGPAPRMPPALWNGGYRDHSSGALHGMYASLLAKPSLVMEHGVAESALAAQALASVLGSKTA